MEKESTNNTFIVAPGAIGDSLLAFQCAHFARERGDSVTVGVSARDDVYEIIHYLFSKSFNIFRLSEDLTSNHLLLKQENPIEYLYSKYDKTPNIDNLFYVVPDLLYNNPYSFPYLKYGLKSPHVIKQHRLLLNNSLINQQSDSKVIYLAPHSSTPGYEYADFDNLILDLAAKLPTDYWFYLPKFDTWAGKQVYRPSEKVLKIPNLIHKEGFIDSLRWLANSIYCISTCNGPSHLAYHFGVPRLIIDPRYSQLPWDSRWKEDVCECICNLMSVDQISNIVRANLLIPQTLLVPRVYAFVERDWRKELMIKELSDL